MGYWDTFTANLFGQDAAGHRTYSPFGKFGKTYVVPDDRATVIRASTRRAYQVMLGGIILTQTAIGWRGNLIVGPLVLVGFYLNSLRHVNGLEVISYSNLVKNSRVENLQRAARVTGARMLSLLLVGSLLFTLAGVWILKRGDQMGWFVVGFFGLCALVFAVQLLFARQGK